MTPVTTAPQGIQETKEALVGINELGLAMARVFVDGVQFADFMDLWKKLSEDEAFKAKLMAAYEGWSKVSGELADLDVHESLEVVGVQLSYIPKFLEIFGKANPGSPAALAAAKATSAKK